MSEIYQKIHIGFLGKIFLFLKGRKDGKNGAFEKKEGMYLSSFMQNELMKYNEYCLGKKKKYLKDINESIELITTEIDEMKSSDETYIRMINQIDTRIECIKNQKSADLKEELKDLNARRKQINVGEDVRKRKHRKICRDNIVKIDDLLKKYDSEIMLKKAYCQHKLTMYLEYARKYFVELQFSVVRIESLCNALEIQEAFEKERKLIEMYKSVIGFNTES